MTAPGRPRPRRASRIVPLAVALVVAAGGGWLLWNRIAQVQQGAVSPAVPPGVTRDPATRARGAVVTLAGPESHPRVMYDPPSGTVTVQFQSKYYDPAHDAKYNRQYLATEGRLVVQLVLYNVPEISRAVAQLYRGSRWLVTVSGAQGDAYNDYSVEYAQGLP